MTTYNSISSIKKDFQIDSDNLEIIRDRLNEIRVNSHPDKTNGQFATDAIKEQYHKANSAIEYLDSINNNHSLMVVEKMTDLMKVVTELIPANRQSSLDQNLDSKITFAITNFRSKMFLPKVSLTAFSAVLTFLFLFPSQIKDNPTLSHLINPTSTTFVLVWFTLLLYSGLFWMMTFSNEEKAKKKLTLLKVDSIQNKLFEEFLSERSIGSQEYQFSKDDLTHFIYQRSHGNRLGGIERPEGLSLITTRLFGSEMITLEIAQNIAEILITRAEKNNVIEKVLVNTLSDTYKLKNYR